MQELFEQILAGHQEKEILALCKKCIKKLSFKSGTDVSNLADLGFWLFIFGDQDAALKVAALTHELPFNHNFSVWEPIHALWGLEVYLLRKSGNAEGSAARRNALIANLRLPWKEETQESHDRNEAKRSNRIEYAEWTR